MPPLSATLAVMIGLQAICTDLYARRVSNRGLLAAAVFGAMASLLFPDISTHPASAAAGMLLGLVLLLPFYAIGWMGAGDVKLFSVLGLLLGAKALLSLWIIASLLAGAYALGVLLLRNTPLLVLVSGFPPANHLHTRINNSAWFQKMKAARQGRVGIPYAAYLGIATLGIIFTRVSHA